MKTLVRIQEGKDAKLGLGFMTVQILIKPYKGSDTINVIGHISFQRNLSEEKVNWYAMKFNLDTDSVDEMQKMTSLLRAIKKHPDYNWQIQPEEIFKIIGAVNYKVFQHRFIEESKEGEFLWDVMTQSDSLHSTIVAPNEKVAKRLLKKKPEGTTLKYNRKVLF